MEVLSLDYKAVSVTGKTEVLPGEEQTYTVTVANDGNSELTGYSVELYVVRDQIADSLSAAAMKMPLLQQVKLQSLSSSTALSLPASMA